MATFIIFFIPTNYLNRRFQISGCHRLMKELFLLLRNFHSKIIHDTDRGDRHTERHYAFLFLVRAAGSTGEGEKIEEDRERSADENSLKDSKELDGICPQEERISKL